MRQLLNNVGELNNEDNYYSWKDTFTKISLPSSSKNASNYNITNKEIIRVKIFGLVFLNTR